MGVQKLIKNADFIEFSHDLNKYVSFEEFIALQDKMQELLKLSDAAN